jgi:hypothetical protein
MINSVIQNGIGLNKVAGYFNFTVLGKVVFVMATTPATWSLG